MDLGLGEEAGHSRDKIEEEFVYEVSYKLKGFGKISQMDLGK